MSVKTAGTGHFQIPTAPAAGTSCTSGAANTYTTTAIQLIASTVAALYITGIYAEEAAVSAATYKSVQLMIGAGGSETVIGQYLISPSTGSTVTRTYRPIFPPVPVATATRIAFKTADSVGALATLVSLEVIAQSNVVDDAIAVTTVTTVTNQLTAAAIATGVWQDATAGDFTVASSVGKAVYIANVAPGASGGHMISGANAGTTTFGAFTVTGATTLTGNFALSDGLTIAAPSTLNRAGLTVTGNGTGAAFALAAGATGKGIAITTTAGDGLSILPTGGDAIVATGNGTSKHGIRSTGGTAGTSDGASFIAGTGGVDFRANQTGNVTGTLSGSVGSVVAGVTVTTNNDKTGYALSAAGIQAVWDALTAALTTVGSIGKRLVDNVDAAISSRSTYAGADTAGTTTLLGRLTAGRATNLDNLDATITSRLAAIDYEPPPSAGDIASTVWGFLTADILIANSIGKLVVDNLNASITSVKALLPSALAADGSIKATIQGFLGTAFTEGAVGRFAANVKTFFNVGGATGTQDVIPTTTALTNTANIATATTAAVFAKVFGAKYGSLTFEEVMKIVLSAAAGVSGGAGTGSATVKTPDGTSLLVTATVDGSGNVTAIAFSAVP